MRNLKSQFYKQHTYSIFWKLVAIATLSTSSVGCRNWCVSLSGLHSKDEKSGKCNTPEDKEKEHKSQQSPKK